jgi:hypothetical protein
MYAMDNNNLLLQLRGERDRLTRAITALEQLALGKKRGPGRPPGSSMVNRQVDELPAGTDGRAGKPADEKQAEQ